MADNTKIGPIFRSANGGLSDDLFTGIKNSFYYSNNIEIREDANSIYPKQAPTSGISFDLGTIGDIGATRASIYFNDAWYVFGRNEVCKLDLGGETFSTLGTAGRLTTDINDVELFNGYVYFSTTKYLYRISQTAADADWASSANFTRMDLNDCQFHPLYATDIFLAVGNGNSVGKVTKEVPDQLQTGIELQTDYEVRFINELGGFLRVTATDGHYGNEILLWDKVSAAADEIIPMSGYKFLQSCVYNGYHYLLSNKGLGLVNGYQYYILKKAEQEEQYASLTPVNGMLVYDDKLYFVNKNGIFIYGAKNKNYADVLNLWASPIIGKNNTPGRPQALGTDGDVLIYSEVRQPVGASSSHVYVYVYKPGETIGIGGEFQTMGYFGSSLSEIKQAMYLRIGYEFQKSTLSPGGSKAGILRVYYRTEASSDWIEISGIEGLRPSSDARSPFATTLKLNCRFQWIQFRFVFNQGYPYYTPLKLYSADLYYNDMLD